MLYDIVSSSSMVTGTAMIPSSWVMSAVATQTTDLLGAEIFLGVLGLSLGIVFARKIFRLVKGAAK